MPRGFPWRRAIDYGDLRSLTFFASCQGNGRFIQCRTLSSKTGLETPKSCESVSDGGIGAGSA